MTAADRVLWFDWTDEAFRKARAEDRPIVLALGASWSRAWRVMERETYGDPEVAALLNRDYVPIRVDADRRPDIQDRYTLGDWPTTGFLMPTGELIGGALALDPVQMKKLLLQLKPGYAAQREKLAAEIARRDEKVEEVLHPLAKGNAAVSMEIFRKTVRGIVGAFDPVHAGFGKAPKLPCVPALRIVLQAYHETQGPDFQEILFRTLDAMGDRGMYDGVAGGFFRCSMNDTWTVPRFEKLCEENAALIRLYLDASVVTGKDKYREKAMHALAWVRATLEDPDRGVFAGSQYGDDEYYMASDRPKRPSPPVDRTVYVPACAAMASTFLRAAQVTGKEALAEVALRALGFLRRECVTSEGVAHFHDGRPQLFTLARDRIALGAALLDAWEHTAEARWLDAAREVAEPVAKLFWSDAEKGIVDRAVDALDRGELVRLRREIPENGLAALNGARLWRLTGEDAWRAEAERIITAFPDLLDGYGHGTAEYALATDWLVRPADEVRAGDLEALRAWAPRRVAR